ncbi:MAG: hypothetical protein PHV68_02115 [Candidatus Gastranaerophilales bacterium]|nr:hypothetical protein [Candidatus Gastranaerophilales bacterium]
MYIIEAILRFIKNNSEVKKIYRKSLDLEDVDECEHLYVPIDSTEDYMACTKCGHVIKNTKKAAVNFYDELKSE